MDWPLEGTRGLYSRGANERQDLAVSLLAAALGGRVDSAQTAGITAIKTISLKVAYQIGRKVVLQFPAHGDRSKTSARSQTTGCGSVLSGVCDRSHRSPDLRRLLGRNLSPLRNAARISRRIGDGLIDLDRP